MLISMIADLYDFDKTVFNGESGSRFWLFCLKRHPSIIKYLPKQLKGLLGYYVFHKISKKDSKELFYSYLPSVDAEKEAELFWDKNESKINSWFKPNEHDVPTIICSASPLFQIKPICDRLGVRLVIATRMNPKSGKITGENCKKEEKVKRIEKEAPEYEIRDVYTDNLVADAPILNLSTRKKYHVQSGKLSQV
jgi:HAD superfamily phosphoserine phosphatase-like hydrolase